MATIDLRPLVYFESAPEGPASLQSVIASCCCDLDATVAESYNGLGQTWSNLVVSPADGTSQTDYDFYLGGTSGSDATDPIFTGTPGDSGAYFASGS